MYKFHKDGEVPNDGSTIFVFGSNQKGYHGAGAALEAYQNFGAYMGVAEGLYGRSYAIPTKDEHLRTLPIDVIRASVRRFIEFAKDHRDMNFFVTRIGCGYAGLSNNRMASMFHGAPDNCSFATSWKPWLLGED